MIKLEYIACFHTGIFSIAAVLFSTIWAQNAASMKENKYKNKDSIDYIKFNIMRILFITFVLKLLTLYIDDVKTLILPKIDFL